VGLTVLGVAALAAGRDDHRADEEREDTSSMRMTNPPLLKPLFLRPIVTQTQS
jgi:hypothetical protein